MLPLCLAQGFRLIVRHLNHLRIAWVTIETEIEREDQNPHIRERTRP